MNFENDAPLGIAIDRGHVDVALALVRRGASLTLGYHPARLGAQHVSCASTRAEQLGHADLARYIKAVGNAGGYSAYLAAGRAPVLHLRLLYARGRATPRGPRDGDPLVADASPSPLVWFLVRDAPSLVFEHVLGYWWA